MRGTVSSKEAFTCVAGRVGSQARTCLPWLLHCWVPLVVALLGLRRMFPIDCACSFHSWPLLTTLHTRTSLTSKALPGRCCFMPRPQQKPCGCEAYSDGSADPIVTVQRQIPRCGSFAALFWHRLGSRRGFRFGIQTKHTAGTHHGGGVARVLMHQACRMRRSVRQHKHIHKGMCVRTCLHVKGSSCIRKLESRGKPRAGKACRAACNISTGWGAAGLHCQHRTKPSQDCLRLTEPRPNQQTAGRCAAAKACTHTGYMKDRRHTPAR